MKKIIMSAILAIVCGITINASTQHNLAEEFNDSGLHAVKPTQQLQSENILQNENTREPRRVNWLTRTLVKAMPYAMLAGLLYLDPMSVLRVMAQKTDGEYYVGGDGESYDGENLGNSTLKCPKGCVPVKDCDFFK